MIKKSLGERTFGIFNIAFMCFLILIMLYPLLFVLFASFSDPAEFMKHNGALFAPLGFSTDAYTMMLKNPNILTGFGNTLFIECVGVPLNILLTAFGAYFLTRKDIYGQRVIMFLIVFTMYFSGGTIPFYFVVRSLGLEDNIWSLILPGAISTFNLIIMKTAFAQVPESLVESAQIEGAGHFTILFRIIMPLTKASIAVLVLYYAVSHWNAWFNAMLFMSTKSKFPLQLVLREILIEGQMGSMMSNVDIGARSLVSETMKYAVIIVSTAPILCVYPFVQKYFVKGVMIGAVKG